MILLCSYLDKENYNYQGIIDDLESDLVSIKEDYDSLDIQYDDLRTENEEVEEKCNKLQSFYDYMKELYGEGLEVTNWYLNGDLEPFDTFFDSAEETMK